MPVSQLLCEGAANSPDVRVLNKLLAGRLEVRPMGGKYGMGANILARREHRGSHTVFGLLDGDFLRSWEPPHDRPREWRASDETMLGWHWERKEIENYLVDPTVVQKSLRLDAELSARYVAALQAARDAIAVYQAARTSLATCRKRFRPLASSFGRERTREKHVFPDALDDRACREGIRSAVAEHRESQFVESDEVLNRFEALLPEFSPGGIRHRDYLHAYAGKDLLCSMDPALRLFGFASAVTFREKVLIGITQTTEDVGGWLAEWAQLREIVETC